MCHTHTLACTGQPVKIVLMGGSLSLRGWNSPDQTYIKQVRATTDDSLYISGRNVMLTAVWMTLQHRPSVTWHCGQVSCTLLCSQQTSIQYCLLACTSAESLVHACRRFTNGWSWF